jgi:hypothetical protein
MEGRRFSNSPGARHARDLKVESQDTPTRAVSAHLRHNLAKRQSYALIHTRPLLKAQPSQAETVYFGHDGELDPVAIT